MKTVEHIPEGMDSSVAVEPIEYDRSVSMETFLLWLIRPQKDTELLRTYRALSSDDRQEMRKRDPQVAAYCEQLLQENPISG